MGSIFNFFEDGNGHFLPDLRPLRQEKNSKPSGQNWSYFILTNQILVKTRIVREKIHACTIFTSVRLSLIGRIVFVQH